MRSQRFIPFGLSALAARACTCLVAACLIASCAASKRRVGVNIEQRPTPPQPDSAALATGAPVQPEQPKTVTMTPQTRQSTLAVVVADTTAARQALQRCAGRKLQADQEGVVESTSQLLMGVHGALVNGDLPRAQSLARQAKQLSASLGCR